MTAGGAGPMGAFVKRIHFVGIGGVGMSGIAQVLLTLGYKVTGSDLRESELTRRLRRLGARVAVGHRAAHVAGAQAVVVSSAIDRLNPELREARRRGVPVVARAQMLAEIARTKKTITVSGSHGKTTTTSMVSMALAAAGVDPTLVLGGQLANIGSNARLGSGEYLVAEADESDGSFLHLLPLAAVVTNIDTDHLDYYGTLEALKAAFVRHLENLPFYGAAVLCFDDPVLRSLFPKVQRPMRTYGLGAGADWRGRLRPVSPFSPGAGVDVVHKGRKRGSFRLQVAGRHNALNALAAVALGDFLGLDLRRVLEGLSEFKGVSRRMERLGEAGGVLFMDDYGHHPTEIKATLEALGAYRRGRVLVLFQPHRYSRTRLLHREFGPAFLRADHVYVAGVYAAGEKPLPGVDASLILASLKRAGVSASPFGRTVDLARDLRPGDLLLTLGAGDVWKIGLDLLRRAQDRVLAAL